MTAMPLEAPWNRVLESPWLNSTAVPWLWVFQESIRKMTQYMKSFSKPSILVIFEVVFKEFSNRSLEQKPDPNQLFLRRISFHLGVNRGVWGMLQAYVGVPLE